MKVYMQFSFKLRMKILLLCAMVVQLGSSQIAVVVNPENSIDDISSAELGQIFLGKKLEFSNGKHIVLAELAGKKQEFYKALLGYSNMKVKKYWIRSVMEGKRAVPPIELSEKDEIITFLHKQKGGICFIGTKNVTKQMKVLTVDGKRPEDTGYLQAGEHK